MLYDINLGGALGGITPYVGLGAGYVWTQTSDVGSTRVGETAYEGDHGDYAGQAIVGLAQNDGTMGEFVRAALENKTHGGPRGLPTPNARRAE